MKSRVSGGEAPVIEIEGGPFSGVIYGVEELVQRQLAGGAVQVGTIEQGTGAPLPHLLELGPLHQLGPEQIGLQDSGVMNAVHQAADGFLGRFQAGRRFHEPATGSPRSRSMASFAIRTAESRPRRSSAATPPSAACGSCPGIAINAYGGVVWEMDHQFNLATWLRRHPELAAEMERPAGFQIPDLDLPAVLPASAITSVRGCPSRAENQQLDGRGVAWLAETCEIGGVNIEAGDYGVCGCAIARPAAPSARMPNRRAGLRRVWSHADMADFYPSSTMWSRRGGLMPGSTAEIQWDNLLDPEAMAPLGALPEGGIYQHTLNRTY